MTNRRMQDSDYIYDPDDDLIGLTSAFPAVKGPQSVEYDKGDDAIGLTGAFAPIPDQDEPHAWDEAGKWKDFDWDSYKSAEESEPAEGELAEGRQAEGKPAEAEAAPAEEADAAPEGETTTGSAAETKPAPASAGASGSSRGRHAAPDASMSPRMQKARKTRRALIVVVILLIIAIIAVGFFMFRTFSNSQEEAAHQAQEQVETPKDEQDIADSTTDNAGDAQIKLTDVPSLTSLFGMTSDDAIKAIGHGAMVSASREVNEEGNPIKTNLNVSLNDEPYDSKTGVPTVYLGLNQDGKVVQVGYSASAGALGFGSLSFADAVNNEHVIEKTLAKIGVTVPEGSAVLPADKKEYSTYADDKTTVTRERCSFEGDVDVNGTPCAWSAVLSYDYTTQIVTGNLSDTVRVIYVYVTQK
ncbi:MAG: histone-lysine N-methyltransferase [Eggerthellaceae bacterium]|nr:histone-lysine N-methyltransferase [Eggerthellaceae bacterium]